MTHSTLVAAVVDRSRLVASLALLSGALLGLSPVLRAQTQPPPIDGVTGTIALDGTVEQQYAAARTIVVKTADGVEHLFHYTKELLVHGGKGNGVEALPGLKAGATVVVHYSIVGTDSAAQEIDQIGNGGLGVAEGMVTHIDRDRKHITIRFDDGLTETFQLTDRAATDVGHELDAASDGTTRITVYYSTEAGQKIAHFFRKSS